MDYIDKINKIMGSDDDSKLFITVEYDGAGEFCESLTYDNKAELASAVMHEFHEHAYDDQKEAFYPISAFEEGLSVFDDSFLPDGTPVEELLLKPSYSIGIADSTILIWYIAPSYLF